MRGTLAIIPDFCRGRSQSCALKLQGMAQTTGLAMQVACVPLPGGDPDYTGGAARWSASNASQQPATLSVRGWHLRLAMRRSRVACSLRICF